MAHFAEIDDTGVVVRVVVVSNEELADGRFASGESEQKGIDFLKELIPDSKTWVQTSYNKNFRGVFASVNCIYDEDLDKFKHPQPYPSWIWNNTNNDWEAPVDPEKLKAGQVWNEEKGDWEIPEKPDEVFPSWDWDEIQGGWWAPVPAPEHQEGQLIEWDEENQQWVVTEVS